jgi:hypothetical protein
VTRKNREENGNTKRQKHAAGAHNPAAGPEVVFVGRRGWRRWLPRALRRKHYDQFSHLAYVPKQPGRPLLGATEKV